MVVTVVESFGEVDKIYASYDYSSLQIDSVTRSANDLWTVTDMSMKLHGRTCTSWFSNASH